MAHCGQAEHTALLGAVHSSSAERERKTAADRQASLMLLVAAISYREVAEELKLQRQLHSSCGCPRQSDRQHPVELATEQSIAAELTQGECPEPTIQMGACS